MWSITKMICHTLEIKSSPSQENSAVLSDDHGSLEDLAGKDGHDRAIE